MRHFVGKPLKLATLGVLALALAAATLTAQYNMTVNKDRLLNAQNEPQNWLMMNGDFGATRYSKLSQINRENVKNLRMVWALALGGLQDVGQNGPENELNPLIDNGFMYTSDGWGTIYKIDARDPNRGQLVWVTDPGVKHQGNFPRTRGVALWEDLVIANLPDGRVIAIKRDTGEILWDKMVAATNEFGTKERFVTAPMAVEDKVLIANGAGDAGTRGWVTALEAKTGKELWRWYVIPKPGDPGSETWKDKNNAWKTGGGGIWQTGSYDPVTRLSIWGTGNPVPQYDPQSRPGDNLYTDSAVAINIDTGKLASHFQYTPNDSWDYDEVGVHMLYDTVIGGQKRQGGGPFCRAQGCFSQNGAAYAFLSPNGGLDPKNSEKRTYNSDLYYGSITAFDTNNHKVIAKAVTDIEVRSGATDTAGGVLFTALQDGWVVAYNDDTLEELWRFNVGTPLKGAPATYAIGAKQDLAVQAGGRHLHPVKFDKYQDASYLFVFALN